MTSLRENEGYDVPWEFIARRTAARSPAGTSAASNDVGSKTATGDSYRGNNENEISKGAERMVINKRTTNGRLSAADGEPSVNGSRKDNRGVKKPPIVAPKPAIISNGRCSLTNGGDSSASLSSAARFNKIPGDSSNGIINTPPCGVRAQRMRKERYASGGCTPVGTVSASPALSKNVNSVEAVDELASCVVWEYRKPEHDARPSCEYDAPWDCKRLSSGGRDTPSASCLCPNVGSVSGGRQSVEGDAIYDEPWDVNRGADPIRKAILGLSIRPGKRDSVGISSNNSPSSTSRSTDSRGSATTTTSSNESDGLEIRHSSGYLKHQQYPDLASLASISVSSTVTNGQDSEADEKRTNGATKTPVRVETAFCAKPSPSAALAYGSKKRFQDKDKIIQQLCSGDVVVPPERRSVVRRSVNSAEQHKNDRRSDPIVDSGSSLDNDENQRRARNSVPKDDQTPLPDYDTPWEFTSSPETVKAVKDLQNAQQQPQQQGASKKTEPKSKLNRQHLSLNFGCAALNPSSAKIDTVLPLNEQMWYHGNITRAEAEQRLSKVVEGSFLVRVCESSSRQGEEYALSLRSAKGFMHMKIQQDGQRSWILGYFSQPFESIPVMIRYYSANKLPIKGAEHMRLIRPVADQVL